MLAQQRFIGGNVFGVIRLGRLRRPRWRRACPTLDCLSLGHAHHAKRQGECQGLNDEGLESHDISGIFFDFTRRCGLLL